MSDRKLTLFEIHLDDASFTANATKRLASGLTSDDEESDGEDSGLEVPIGTPEDDDGTDDERDAGGDTGTGAGRAILAVAVLALLAVVVTRLLGGDVDEEFAELSDLDEASPRA